MALILSCLRPMRSVFNDHVKIKSLLAIWQNRTYQHILNISLSFKMMQHFVFSTSETPRSSILSILLQDLILSNFGDMSCLNFLLWLIFQVFTIFRFHQKNRSSKMEENFQNWGNFKLKQSCFILLPLSFFDHFQKLKSEWFCPSHPIFTLWDNFWACLILLFRAQIFTPNAWFKLTDFEKLKIVFWCKKSVPSAWSDSYIFCFD